MNRFIAILTLFIFTAGAALAAPGDLDSSFGSGGKVVTMFSSSAGGSRLATPEAVIVQPDGKIIAAGMARNLLNGGQAVGVALVRYNVDGSLDTSFDGDGTVHIRLNGYDSLHALALMPDGRIIATGIANVSGGGDNDFAFLVMRFNPNGSLDTSFNGTGYRIDNWTVGLDETVACAVQPDGKIIAGGFLEAGTQATDFAMARYNTDGSLDTAFGNGGLVRTDVDGTLDGATALVLKPDGKIILGGTVWNAAITNGDYALIGYNADGTVDATFGTGGKVRTDFDGESQNTFDLELTTGDKLLLTGVVGQPGIWNIAAVRYNADGSLDTSFNGDGRFRYDFPQGAIEGGNAVKTQANGKIVIAGDLEPRGTDFDFAVLRLNADGTFDTSFGNNGITFIDFGSFRPTGGFSNDDLTDMWIAPDGKIVVAGDVELDPNMTHDFGVARFLGDRVSAEIAGTVTYGNASGGTRFVSDVTMTAEGSQTVAARTSESGQYSLGGLGTGAYVVTAAKGGAVNGAITSFDAAMIAQYAAGVRTLTASQLAAGDVSGNGNVSSFDAGQVAKFVAGISPFGTTGNWLFSPSGRNYSSVSGLIAGEDYSALLMGEVSGNWTNTVAKLLNGGQVTAESRLPNRLAVTAANVLAVAGREVIVPVQIRGVANEEIIAYQFDLRYDPNVIMPAVNPVDLEATASVTLSAVANTEESGIIRVVVYGATPLEAGNVLLNLRFITVGATGSASELALENLMFNEGKQPTISTNGRVEISAYSSISERRR